MTSLPKEHPEENPVVSQLKRTLNGLSDVEERANRLVRRIEKEIRRSIPPPPPVSEPEVERASHP